MEWLANEISPNTYVNLMAQYRPEGEVLSQSARSNFADLSRTTTSQEMDEAREAAHKAGFADIRPVVELRGICADCS